MYGYVEGAGAGATQTPGSCCAIARSAFLWLQITDASESEQMPVTDQALVYSHRLPDRVRTSGVVAEEPHFPLMNIHGKMRAKCGNMLQTVATCDKICQMWQHSRIGNNILPNIGKCDPCVKAPFVPTPSASRSYSWPPNAPSMFPSPWTASRLGTGGALRH